MNTTLNPSVPERPPGSFPAIPNGAGETDLFATHTARHTAAQKPASNVFSWPDWRFDRPCYDPSPLNEF
jgi:hypothetical protein